MNRNLLLSLAALALTQPLVTSSADAYTAPGGYTMEVVVGGWTTPEYHARGTTYIEAVAGREYTIRLSNPTGRRVAVALSVDGLNTVDAKRTSAEDATKWVIDPWQTVEIRGWQTSDSTSRAFFFTSEERSYGAWLGQTQNLGVISAAFFPEAAPDVSWWWSQPRADDEGWYDGRASGGAASGAAPSAEASAPRRQESKARASRDVSESMAATGIGRQQSHRVSSVEMELEDDPAAVISLRYEYRPELIRLGVLPTRPQTGLKRREQATGFEEMEFAPDPYRPGW